MSVPSLDTCSKNLNLLVIAIHPKCRPDPIPRNQQENVTRSEKSLNPKMRWIPSQLDWLVMTLGQPPYLVPIGEKCGRTQTRSRQRLTLNESMEAAIQRRGMHRQPQNHVPLEARSHKRAPDSAAKGFQKLVCAVGVRDSQRVPYTAREEMMDAMCFLFAWSRRVLFVRTTISKSCLRSCCGQKASGEHLGSDEWGMWFNDFLLWHVRIFFESRHWHSSSFVMML